MEKKWILNNKADNTLVEGLAKELNIAQELTSILVQRGVSTFEEAKIFFRPSLNLLHDPFLMMNMDHAVNRLCDAVFNNEKMVVYGDYDVDGTTSVAMVYSFLKEFSDHVEFYIPDRYSEGYGISEKGVTWAADNGFSLMIALDCGIRAVDKVELANSLNLDMIICDHHLAGDIVPKATAVLDPKQPGCNYPFKELSGCGVGFKLLQGFCQQNTIPLERIFNYLDLVVVSIGSDIVPIVEENRVLAYYGLKKLNRDPSMGLKSLRDVSGMKKDMSISDVVFYLGPRINATGRLTHAKESVNLLISKSEDDLTELSKILNERNSARKDFDISITAEALEMIEKDFPTTKSSVLFKNDWHKGVVGIVASRCIEHYYRPTIILTESEGKATGSARSVNGFDVHEAIGKCSHLLEQFGGHTHAAGLSLPLENVEVFRNEFERVVSETITSDQLIPKLHIDQKVNFDFINFKTINILNQMAPFGPQNLQPLFWSENVYVKNLPRLIKDVHLKLMVYQEGHVENFDAIAFGFGDWVKKLEPAKPFQLAYYIEENVFQGNKTLQLNVKDIKLAE
ncbi:MAG: single-stranded-DNA-specific exonuclease RecJ [Cytophagales bacterium]|nr:single-stranded-DNA-specific exonuclease RecJ [Cytophagales bacterium]